MAKCKGCGAEILWAKTVPEGKAIPLSVASKEQRFTVRDQGMGLRTQVEDTYLSHFADCPQAERFRRQKGGDDG